MTQPWLKFFLKDWCADRNLRACSLAARGLWLEMLAVMHDAEPRGSFVVAGRQVDMAEFYLQIGAKPREVAKAFQELEQNKVFSRDADQTIFSRRMRRDEEKTAEARETGKKGGNPALKGRRNGSDKRPDNGADNGGVNPGLKPRSQKPESEARRAQQAEPLSREAGPVFDVRAALAFQKEISETFRQAGAASTPDTQRARLWLTQGFDPAICLAVIADGLARRQAVNSLAYFDAAIREAHDQRAAPLTRANGAAETVKTYDLGHGCEISEANLERALREFDEPFQHEWRRNVFGANGDEKFLAAARAKAPQLVERWKGRT